MADTAAVQLKRVLNLIPHLADGEAHSLEDVAIRAGTSVDNLMSDFYSISERFDAPGGFVDGVSILVDENSVSVTANHFLRPMRLTMAELCALELGLMLLRRDRTPVEQAPIDRALERLRQTVSRISASDPHEGTRYADLASAGSAAHLAALRTAVREHHKVLLQYRAGGATESTERVVCPYSLAFAEQMWYVVTTSEDDGVHFFRLDRIESVDVLGDNFEPNATVAARALDSGRAFHSDGARRMTVRYSPRIARWVSEREGKHPDADGSLTVEHQVADDSWALRHVLQYGADAEILEPADLREQLAEKLERCVAG
jgi:predicted DNA-binding transcriptional regulator YafY